MSLLGLACESDPSPSGFTTYTALYVEPADFRGGVVCGGVDGAMKSYVATLYDVSSNDPATVITVASTPPLPCNAPATFSQVVPGNFYVVAIDGYEEPSCSFSRYDTAGCIVPAGGWGSGVRTQVLSDGSGIPPVSAHVSPTWTTRCGRLASAEPPGNGGAGQGGDAGQGGEGQGGEGQAGEGQAGEGQGGEGQGGESAAGQGGTGQGGASAAGQGGGANLGGEGGAAGAGGNPFYQYDPKGPTEAVFQTSARMGGCEPLPAPTGPGRVVIRAEALQGGLSCGKNPGQVARFEVLRDGEAPRVVDCGAEVRFEELTPSTSFEARVFAFESGGSGPRWGSRCTARVAPGQTLAANCAPPSERGALKIPGATLCEGAATYRATVVGVETPIQGAVCPADLAVSGLPAGLVDVVIERKDSAGTVLGAALCSGKVQPGQQVAATCSL